MSAAICGSGITALMRHACYSFAPRDAFLAALRADQRARSRFTARTVMGATTCNAMEAAPATSPLNRSNARSGPKYHMTPRPLPQGHRRTALGKKRKRKSPVRHRRGPRKIPVRGIQRTRNLFGSPAQGGLKNKRGAPHGGRAIETAHHDSPKMPHAFRMPATIKNGRPALRGAAIHLTQPD